MEMLYVLCTLLWKWITSIAGRPPLGSRHRHRASVGVRQLEERIVLNASFAMTGGEVVLNNFDNVGAASTSVTVSEAKYDVDSTTAGNEDVYAFKLNAGTWNGTDVSNVTVANGDTLYILKSAVNDQLQISDSSNNNLQVALQSLGVGTSGAVNADLSVDAKTISLNGNLQTDGKDVILNGAMTLGQNVVITTVSSNPNQNSGNVTLGGTVAGANTRSLEIDAQSGASILDPGSSLAGDVTFQGAVGSSTSLLGITVSGKDVFFADTVSVRTGGVTVTSTGTTTFDGTISTLSAGGLQINSGGDVTLNGNVSTANGAVQITSQSALALNANLNSGTQTISLQAAGDITLGMLTSGNNTVNAVLISSSGEILDGNGGALNIVTTGTSAVTTLRAETGIGATDELEVSLSKLDAVNGTSGDIQLVETNAITVLNLQQEAAGNINLVANGIITINNGLATPAVQNAGPGTIALTAQGANSDVNLQSGVTASGGAITLTADRDVVQSALGSVSSSGGDVTAKAARFFNMANGTMIDAGIGKIDIQSSGNATLGLLKSQKLNGEAVKVVSLGAGILDANDTDPNVEANQAGAITTFSAVTGIGAANRIEVDATILDVINSASGNIRIAESNHVLIDKVIQLAGAGTIELTALNGSIGAANAGSRIETQTGTVSVTAFGDVTLGQVKTGNTSVNAVSITSQGGAILGMAGTDPNIVTTGTAAVTTLSAATGIGTDMQALRTDISRLSATNSTSGDIQISEANEIVLVNLKQTGSTATGKIGLIAGGTITVFNTNPNAVQAQGSGEVQLKTTGSGTDILVQGKINAENGDIVLDAANNIGLTATGQVSTAGNVNFAAGNEIKGTTTGTHVVANDFVATAATGITLLNTAVDSLSATNSTSGDIQIKEADNVVVTGLIQSTGSGNISLTTVNGAITIDGGTPATTAVQTHGSGTILLDANHVGGTSWNLNVLSGIASESGNISLAGDQDLILGSGASVTSQTGALSATAVNGAIDMQGTSAVNAGSGNVTLLAKGNVTLGHIETSSNTVDAVRITSQTGAILDGGNAAQLNILAHAPGAITTLNAVTGIGTGAAPLRVDLDRIVATNSGVTGDIRIEESNELTLQSMRQSSTSSNGSIAVTALQGPLTIDNGSPSVIAVQTYGTGSIRLAATGTDADLSVRSKISSANGAVDFLGNRNVVFGDAGDVTSTSGALSVAATTGEIQMNSGTQFNAGSGEISLDAKGDLTLADLRTTNDTGNAVSLLSRSGAILDGNGATINITAANPSGVTTLRAATGMGSSDALEVDLGQLDAENSTSGDIHLVESNAITILNLQQTNPAGDGLIDLATLAGSITIDSPTDDIAVQTHGTGAISLNAAGTSADMFVRDAIQADQGQIALQSTRHMTFDQQGNVTTSGDLSLQAGGTVNSTGSQQITATGLTVTAGMGIVLNTSVETLSANNGTSGDIRILETDEITVTALTQAGGSGQVSLVTQNGSITVDNGQVPPGNTIAVEAKVNGTVLLQAGGSGAELILNTGIKSVNGTITLLADGDVRLGDLGDVTSTGANAHVSITSTTGEIAMASGTEIRAGGAIDLNADQGDITLGLVRSTFTNGNAVTITSGGAILDGNGTDLNIDANGLNALTTLNAVSGIGAATPANPLDSVLEVNLTRLSATNGASGDLRFAENDGLSVVNLTQTTSTGNIELTANGSVTIENTTPGTAVVQANGPGNVTLKSLGTTSDLNVQGGISSGGGNVTLEAGRNATFGTDGDIVSQGGDVAVTSRLGALQMGNGTAFNSGSGAIDLQAQGTITLGVLTSAQSSTLAPVTVVSVTSKTGAILDGNGAALNIDANAQNAKTFLRAATGIGGVAGDPLETQTTILDAINSTSGSIQIQETDDIVVENLRQNAGSGSVTLNTINGGITVSDTNPVAVQAFSVGTITLNAQGTDPDSNLTIRSQIQSAGGAITLQSRNNVILDGTADVLSNTGSIGITAETGTVQILNAVTVTTANNITLQADTGITLNGLLETTGNGSVQVTTSTGDIIVDNGVNPAIKTSGVGTLTLDAQGADSDIAVQSQIQSAGGAISLHAYENVALSGNANVISTSGNIGVNADKGMVNVLDGLEVTTANNITLQADTGITLNGLLETTGNGSVQVTTSTGDIIVDNGVNPAIKTSGVGTLTLDAQGADSDIAVRSQIQSELRQITLSAMENVVLSGSGDVSSTSGNIVISAQKGTIQVLDVVTVTTANNITLQADTGITLNGLLETTGNGNIQATTSTGDFVVNNGSGLAVKTSGIGTILLDAHGDTSNLSIQSGIQSSLRDITLHAGNNVDFGDDGDVTTSSGSVFVTADHGFLFMADGSKIETGSGRIHLDAQQEITLGELKTNGANNALADAAVMVTSRGGAIQDGNGAGMNITANNVNSRTVLSAASGIGGTDPLEVNLRRLNADVTGTGGIQINEADNIILSNVQTANGAIAITAGGALFANSVVSETDAEANDITLISSGGGMIVETVNAGPSHGDVTLQSAGAISPFGTGPHVTADALTATAVTGINLQTAVNSLTAHVTSPGAIQITETDAIHLVDVQTRNGPITVTAAGSITATNVISQTDADTNEIALTSTGGGINVQNINAGTGSGDVVLNAQGGSIQRVGPSTQVNVTADDLNATSVSGIDLYTNINDLVAFVSGTGDILIEESNDIRLASSDAGTDDGRIETTNGRIQVRAAGSITIVDTDNSNDGPDRRGDEEIIAGGVSSGDPATSAGRILLQAGNVDGSTVGDLIFQPNAQISAVGAAGDRGAITLVTSGNFEFDPNSSQITTYNGTEGGILRNPVPTIDNLTGGNPDLVASGNNYRGTFQVQLGAGTAGEKGLEIHIDWGDTGDDRYEGPDYGSPTALNGSLGGLDGQQQLTLAHDYTIEDVQSSTGNGRSNLTDPLQVRFSVLHDPSIVIVAKTLSTPSTAPAPSGKVDGDLSLLTTSNNLQGSNDRSPLDPVALLGHSLPHIQSGNDVSPARLTTDVNTMITFQQNEMLENGVQTFRVPPIILPRDLLMVRDPGYPVAAPPVPAVLPSSIVTPALQVVPAIPVASSTTFFRDEYFQIKVLSPDPDAVLPLAPPERLPDDILSGDRLNQLFQQLPDGQYQIDYVLGEGNERSILKFDIRMGQPVVPGGEALDGGQLKLEDVTEQLRRVLESASKESPENGPAQPLVPESRTVSDVEKPGDASTVFTPLPVDAAGKLRVDNNIFVENAASRGEISRESEKTMGNNGPHPSDSHGETKEIEPEWKTLDKTGSGETSSTQPKLGLAGPALTGATALLRKVRRRRLEPARFSVTGKFIQRLKNTVDM